MLGRALPRLRATRAQAFKRADASTATTFVHGRVRSPRAAASCPGRWPSALREGADTSFAGDDDVEVPHHGSLWALRPAQDLTNEAGEAVTLSEACAVVS